MARFEVSRAMLSAAFQLLLTLFVMVATASIVGALAKSIVLSSIAAISIGAATFAYLEQRENGQLDHPRAFKCQVPPERALAMLVALLRQKHVNEREWQIESNASNELRATCVFTEQTVLRDTQWSQRRTVEMKVFAEPLADGALVRVSYRVHSPGNRYAVNALIGRTTAILQTKLVRHAGEEVPPSTAYPFDLQEMS